MEKQTFFAGYFIVNGALQDLMIYPNLDCARDTLRETMNDFSVHHDPSIITDAGIFEVDLDGSCDSVEALVLPFQPY